VCWNGWFVVLFILYYYYLLRHGAEPFLRSRQLFSHSRTPQHFTQPEGSIPCSQEPSTDPYPEPHQSNPHHPILSEIHPNIVHPPTSRSSQSSLSFWLSRQYSICIPPLSICATCSAHLMLLDLFVHTQFHKDWFRRSKLLGADIQVHRQEDDRRSLL
jgi:hypothetical protein